MSAMLERAVASRRLAASSETAASTTFSVERSEALLRLRNRPGRGRWDWTLTLARALLSLCDGGRIALAQDRVGEHDVVRITIACDPSALVGLPQRSWLDLAIEPDASLGDGDLAQRQLRFLRLLGRAINEAFAFDPIALHLRVFDRSVSFTPSGDGPDPWRESAPVAETPDPERVIEIHVTIERNLQRFVDKMLGRDGRSAIVDLLRARVPGGTISSVGGVLRAAPNAGFVRLGEAGRLWSKALEPRLSLLLDGVALNTAIAAALGSYGVQVVHLHGWITAPKLRLTFDEVSVVEDDALATLAAWCHDALAHGSYVLPMTPEQYQYARFAGRTIPPKVLASATWPTKLGVLYTVDRRAVTPEQLAWCAANDWPVPYVWPHERNTTPPELAANTLVLWPSELELLRAAFPTLQTKPVAAYRVDSGSADFKAIVQGSFPELELDFIVTSTEVPLRIDVVAYVHRNVASARGRVVVGRVPGTLGTSEDPALAIPGVTLIGRIREGEGTRKLGSGIVQAAMRAIAEHGRARMSEIVAHARAQPEGAGVADALAAVVFAPARKLAPRAVALRNTPSLVTLDVEDASCNGMLVLADPDRPASIEVWTGVSTATEVVLPEPLSPIGGRIWLRGSDVAHQRDALLHGYAWQLVQRAITARMLAHSGSDRRAALARFVDRCAPVRASAAPDLAIPPFTWPHDREYWLSTLVAHALQRPLQLLEAQNAARWPVGVDADVEPPRVVVDSRHILMLRTRDPEATSERFVRAAMMIVAHTCAQLRVPASGALLRLLAGDVLTRA